MTVRAFAKFDNGGITGNAGDGNSYYNVSYYVTVADDTVNHDIGLISFLVPVSLKNQKKLDDFIRQAIADAIHAGVSLVIDPDDIYIPFSAR